MRDILDSFWRAVAYCLHPRVILLSLLPIAVVAGALFALAYFFWADALDAVRNALQAFSLTAAMMQWLQAIGLDAMRTVLPILIVVALAVPLMVVFSLLLVALVMTPAIVRLVAARRFPAMEKKRGGGVLSSVAWSVGCTLVALVATVLSIPLWFVPPLVLVIPPLIWGWLTYRVMAFDVLADHASAEERRRIIREQRWTLLAIGIGCGYLNAAPSLLWAVSAGALIYAPWLIPLAVWLYTLVFIFCALWFAHFCLAALQRLRAAQEPPVPPPPPQILSTDSLDVPL